MASRQLGICERRQQPSPCLWGTLVWHRGGKLFCRIGKSLTKIDSRESVHDSVDRDFWMARNESLMAVEQCRLKFNQLTTRPASNVSPKKESSTER